MRKKMLEKRVAKLEAKRQTLAQRALDSQDAAEVRSLNDQIADINDQIEDCREEISVLEAEEAEAKQAEEARAAQAQAEVRDAVPVNANITNAFSQNVAETRDDPYATLEYRQAFKDFVQKGVAIPSNFATRSDDVLSSKDIGAIIPTTILNEFIKDVEKVYGQLYSKVRKLNIPGGVKVPIADLQASFKWINESTVSKTQRAGEAKQYVEFSYNIGEIRIAETLLASILSLSAFESEITKALVEAYVKAMDEGIIKGTGEGQMLGILNDPRVTENESHIIEMTAAQFNNWVDWKKRFFAKLPISASRQGCGFIFPLSTVMSYLSTMADSNNNPIFKEAAALNVIDGDKNTDGYFFGREVTLVEPEIIKDFDTAQAGDVVGIYWNPKDYAINTNLQIGWKRYYDDDLNQWISKGLTVVDGRILSTNSCYLIVKK